MLTIAAAALALGAYAPLVAAQESLGDVARQVRMHKPAPAAGEKVYTNDNLPTSSGLGVATVTTASTPASDSTTASAASTPAPPTEQSQQEKEKAYAGWKQKIEAQKSQISMLEREINVLQREAQIRGAVFYADAGTRLRDPKAYADAVRQNQQDTQAKQQELNDAKQKLDDMQEQARKAGVPASSYE